MCLLLTFFFFHLDIKSWLRNYIIYILANMYRMFPIFFKTTASLLYIRKKYWFFFFFKILKSIPLDLIIKVSSESDLHTMDMYGWLSSWIFWNSHLSNPVVCCCGRSRTPNGSKTSGRPNHHYFYKEWKIAITFHEEYIFWSLWDIHFWFIFLIT